MTNDDALYAMSGTDDWMGVSLRAMSDHYHTRFGRECLSNLHDHQLEEHTMTTKTTDQAKPTELTEEAAEKVRGGVIATPPDPHCIGCVKDPGPKGSTIAVDDYLRSSETIAN